jgi:hypothetical protein
MSFLTLQNFKKDQIAWLITLVGSALLFIWPLPNTIALRHMLLGLGFIFSLPYLRPFRRQLTSTRSWSLWVLVFFFAWLLIHLLLFSTEFNFQKDELLSVWMRSFLALPIGLAMGLILQNANASSNLISCGKSAPPGFGSLINLIFFIGLNGTVIIFFLNYVFHAIETGQIIYYNFFQVSYLAKTPFVVSCALLVPLCFIYINQILNKKVKPIWLVPIFASLSLTLFSLFFANTKNGFVILLLSLVQFITLLIYQHWSLRSFRLKHFFIVGTLLSAFFVGAYFHVQQNPAWLRMMTEVRYGIDIDHQNHWKDRIRYPAPTYENGETVNGSAYERSAWFIAGLHLLPKYPQGYGLLTHSFGRLAKREWSDFNHPVIGKTYLATHSGWMDMALGVGIIGVLFLWIPMGVAWWRSLHGNNISQRYVAWSIPIVFITYLTTELAGAHFTELLVFLIAFYCGITLLPTQALLPPKTKDI